MKKIAIVALPVIVAALAVAGASATTKQNRGGKGGLRAVLNGYQEVPSVSTRARGRFTMRLSGNAMTFRLVYAGLEAPATAAHIHLGQIGVAGGVIAFLCGGPKGACPSPGGTVTGRIGPEDVVGPTAQGIAPREFAEVVRAARVGVTYVNVHSTKFPAGEIRGQILPRSFFRRGGK